MAFLNPRVLVPPSSRISFADGDGGKTLLPLSQIRPFLPPRLRLSSKWTLLYSLDQHGISVHTLFSNLDRGLRDRDGGFVLVVKSERGEIFGAYCSEALQDASATRGPAQRWAGDGSS